MYFYFFNVSWATPVRPLDGPRAHIKKILNIKLQLQKKCCHEMPEFASVLTQWTEKLNSS